MARTLHESPALIRRRAASSDLVQALTIVAIFLQAVACTLGGLAMIELITLPSHVLLLILAFFVAAGG